MVTIDSKSYQSTRFLNTMDNLPMVLGIKPTVELFLRVVFTLKIFHVVFTNMSTQKESTVTNNFGTVSFCGKNNKNRILSALINTFIKL